MMIQKNHKVIYMTPQELEALRIEMGLSVAAFARVLGLNVVSLHNMRAGRQRIRQFNALAIRWMHALWKMQPDHPALPIEIRAANDNLDSVDADQVE